MVEVKQKKETPPLVADLQEVEDFIVDDRGTKCRLRIADEWYILRTSTPVQMQNVLNPLEVGKQVKCKYYTREYKGKPYNYINTIEPYNIVSQTLPAYKPDEYPSHLEKEAKRIASNPPKLIEQLTLIKTELLLLETNTNTYHKFVVELCKAIEAKLNDLQKQADVGAFV